MPLYLFILAVLVGWIHSTVLKSSIVAFVIASIPFIILILSENGEKKTAIETALLIVFVSTLVGIPSAFFGAVGAMIGHWLVSLIFCVLTAGIALTVFTLALSKTMNEFADIKSNFALFVAILFILFFLPIALGTSFFIVWQGSKAIGASIFGIAMAGRFSICCFYVAISQGIFLFAMTFWR